VELCVEIVYVDVEGSGEVFEACEEGLYGPQRGEGSGEGEVEDRAEDVVVARRSEDDEEGWHGHCFGGVRRGLEDAVVDSR
jgi:hypothetical protein